MCSEYISISFQKYMLLNSLIYNIVAIKDPLGQPTDRSPAVTLGRHRG